MCLLFTCIVFLSHRKVFKIGVLKSNQWLSEFEDDIPDVRNTCTDCPGSLHASKGKSSTLSVGPKVLLIDRMDIYYLKLYHLLFMLGNNCMYYFILKVTVLGYIKHFWFKWQTI